MTTRFRTCPFFRTAVFSFCECYLGPGEKYETLSKISRPTLRPHHPAKSQHRSPHLRPTHPSRSAFRGTATPGCGRRCAILRNPTARHPGRSHSIPTTASPENVASTAPAPLSTRHFLIGCAAIKNARNSPENNALRFSNRLKTANCSARFSRVLRSNNHESRVAGHGSRFTTHQSLLTNHYSPITHL
jgi:hypothetical protein